MSIGDVDSIERDLDFAEAIEAAVGHCDVLLVLIGIHRIDAAGKDGRRCLDDPDDFVAREITAAVWRGIRVIPVLIDGQPAAKAPASRATTRQCFHYLGCGWGRRTSSLAATERVPQPGKLPATSTVALHPAQPPIVGEEPRLFDLDRAT